MKNLIEKTKTIYKKSFTLIELIAVIVVIGILAAIVIPNIASFKEEASVTAMEADGKNLQTAVDLYQLDHHGAVPTINREELKKPVLGLPQNVDFAALYPTYIRDLPQAKNMYYWIDHQGQFYYSTTDNPTDFMQEDSGLTWTANEKASGYRIYEASGDTTGSSKKTTLNMLEELSGETSSYVPANYSKERQYFIDTVDEYGNAAPPVKPGFTKGTPFTPDEVEEIVVPDEPKEENSELPPTSPKEDDSVLPTTPEQEEIVGNPTNKMVVAGNFHTLVIMENGELWSFGRNTHGQLGHSENVGNNNPNPVPTKIMDNVQWVSAGLNHSLVVKKNGELWSFGRNAYGQLGHSENIGTNNPNPLPIKVMDNIKSVVAGDGHSLAVKNNGELWSFGGNHYGNLGHSIKNGTGSYNPEPIKVLDGVQSVAAGYYHSLALKENGELWSFGRNNYGQLGFVENIERGNPTPTKVMDTVRSVDAGDNHTLVVKENGELWSFGRNYFGELGHSFNNISEKSNPRPTKIMSNVKSVAAGIYHSLVVKENGELWSFGRNYSGESGHSINNSKDTPNPIPVKVMEDVQMAAAGRSHSLVMKNNGEIWSFGINSNGELGHLVNSGASYANPIPRKVVFPN